MACTEVRVPVRVFIWFLEICKIRSSSGWAETHHPEYTQKDFKDGKIVLEYHYWVCSRAVCYFLSFGFFRISDMMIGLPDAEIRQLDK